MNFLSLLRLFLLSTICCFFSGGFYSDVVGYVGLSCKKCPSGSFVHFDKAPGTQAQDCKSCPQGIISNFNNFFFAHHFFKFTLKNKQTTKKNNNNSNNNKKLTNEDVVKARVSWFCACASHGVNLSYLTQSEPDK